MSWFDKLFGEDNDSNDDLIHRKKKRRQESQNIDNDHDSLLPQNNDIYSRPRGKFRFPMSVAYENENVEQSADTISDEKEQYHRDYRKQSHDSRSQNDIAVEEIKQLKNKIIVNNVGILKYHSKV